MQHDQNLDRGSLHSLPVQFAWKDDSKEKFINALNSPDISRLLKNLMTIALAATQKVLIKPFLSSIILLSRLLKAHYF